MLMRQKRDFLHPAAILVAVSGACNPIGSVFIIRLTHDSGVSINTLSARRLTTNTTHETLTMQAQT